MNERIQELAVKAKLMAEEDINRQLSYNAELKAFAEKFAELIVQECGKVVYNYTNKTETHVLYGEVGWECLPGDLEIQILEHFGVEE